MDPDLTDFLFGDLATVTDLLVREPPTTDSAVQLGEARLSRDPTLAIPDDAFPKVRDASLKFVLG